MALLNNLLVMFAFTMFASTATINGMKEVPNASEIVIEEPDLPAPATNEETLKYKIPKQQETVSAPTTDTSTLNDKTGS